MQSEARPTILGTRCAIPGPRHLRTPHRFSNRSGLAPAQYINKTLREACMFLPKKRALYKFGCAPLQCVRVAIVEQAAHGQAASTDPPQPTQPQQCSSRHSLQGRHRHVSSLVGPLVGPSIGNYLTGWAPWEIIRRTSRASEALSHQGLT